MKKNQKIVMKLMSVSTIIMVIATVALTIVGSVLVSNGFEKMNKELLKNACLTFKDDLDNFYKGEWTEKEDGVYKGDTRISENYAMVDALKKDTGLEYSVFYGNMRISTTLLKEGSSERAVNSPALERIVNIVINGNQQYFGKNVKLEGVAYNIYYEPLTDSSGKAVGMVFAGRNYADIHADINRAIIIMAVIALVLVIITVVYAFIQNHRLEPVMKEIVTALENMAGGSLNIDIHQDALNRRDELGRIAECMQKLDGELSGVIKKTLQLADNVSSDGRSLSSSSDSASGASNQVTDAMEDISKGAVSQAENIETAANDTSNIGDAIEGINDKVEELDKYTDIMKVSCDNAMQALQHLLDQNVRVIESMKIIEHQILSTNEAVKNISNASNLITSISSQTNLLALNASIEAARAGEAGRGFAVVATEIGALAEQSRAATVEIKTIVSDLIAESEKSVQTVNELSESFKVQSEQLDSTVSDMHEMQSGVVNVTASANDISSRSNNLNEAKNNLVDIISDLSAISQENAAATEETNASMEELNATFEVINQSAENLQELAKELHEEIRFFTVHEG